MEILILGGILVAVMVYVSTRIKKSAAEAYEPEIVENENFAFYKPQDFLIPIGENSVYALEARSKDYGGDRETRQFPQVKINLREIADENFVAVCRNAEQSAGKILSKTVSRDDLKEQQTCLLEAEKTEGEIPFYVLRKIVGNWRKGKVFDLEIAALESFREEYADKIKRLADDFIVK